MKKLLYLIINIVTLHVAYSQETGFVEYSNMPPGGFYLDSGWRYAPDDNPEYAKPGFNDAAWDTINPTKPFFELPELKNVRTGWLRLHFRANESFTEVTPLLTVSQYCASEIYLDGKLLKRYGVVRKNPDEVVPIGINQPAEVLHIVPDKEYVLAVRFSPWQSAFYLKNARGFMSLKIDSFESYQAHQKEQAKGWEAYFILVSIFFLVSLLHLSFYRYDRAQRANIYFSVYTVISAIAFSFVCMQHYAHDIRVYTLVWDPAFILALMGSIWTVKAMGSLFAYNVRRLVTAMWIVYAIAVIVMVSYELFMPFNVATLIFQSVNIGMAIRALKQGRRGAGMIVTGFIFSFLALIPSRFPVGVNFSDLTYHVLIGLTYLAPAIGISLYLAREFALNTALLREKLVEVEALSQKSLQQEYEKQELLSRQNEVLEQQVEERTAALSQSLTDLKLTQNQLIQSEKMASLGELTAGIAHEIQNPLNFVNNFSDVSIELLEEMREELDKGDTDEAKAIAADVKDNLTKIAHHGRRADSIVKGMLQHSRASSGQKEPTDINALADEYLRLAYHGLRAKDKSFNADLITHFAEGLPKISMVPQDMGRVLLNLFTNAFYATQERSRQVADGSFKPVVEISTQLKGNSVEIVVKDNGTGIPDAIKDKILQPFFTTKPTGEGTGLGLSLSYDIVVKAHGGTIDIESAEGQGAAFIINLPIN